MRKFSLISNYNVPSEPKVEVKEESKADVLKSKLLTLMNDILKIQSTGAARTELINSAITISGKESLADSIVDLLNNEFNSEKVSLLESMKLEMNDWLYLDNKIEQINNRNIQEKNTKNTNIERRLMIFLDLYGEEKDYDLHTEMMVNRINKRSDLIDRIRVVESMIQSGKLTQKQTKQIKLLAEKFKQRVK